MSTKVKSHAKYSPSSSHRWLECPASVELSALLPAAPDTAASREGTDAHTCLEIFLKNGIEKQLSTERFLVEKYPLQMVIHAAWAAKEIWKLTPQGALLLAETRSELFHIDAEMHGTTDASIVDHFGTLQIIDFKYGRMPVEVEENTQMIAYAIGIAHKFDYNFADVVCTVIQPRANHVAGPVRSWKLTIDSLLQWSGRFKLGVALTKHPEAPFKSGEHCFFCPAKPTCIEYTPEATGSVRSRFVTQASPEKRRAQMLVDFGDAPNLTEENTTDGKPKRARRAQYCT